MNKKRAALIITSMIAIVVVTAGMALAYLQATTGMKTNAFSSNKNINIQLREENWDGYDFNDVAGDGSKAESDSMDLGYNQAQNYLPGQVIDKDPTVKNGNDKDDVKAHVAIRVRYYSVDANGTKNQMSYDEFQKTFLAQNGINFSNEWTKLNNTEKTNDQVYIYNNILEKNAKTTALFTEVALSETLGAGGQLPGFSIEVQAFGIQADHVENVNDTMLKFVNAN